MFDLIKKTGNIDNERAQINKALRAIAAAIGGIISDVTSVFGRTGAVVAESGDYSMDQISGEVDNSQHGNRGGGDLHALATPTVHGFMSSADKAKINAQPIILRGSRWTNLTIGTSMTDVSGVEVELATSSKYSVDLYIHCNAIDSPSISISFTTPSGTNYQISEAENGRTGSSTTYDLGSSGPNDRHLSFRGTVQSSSTAGTLRFRMQRTGGTSLTVHRGWIVLTKLQ